MEKSFNGENERLSDKEQNSPPSKRQNLDLNGYNLASGDNNARNFTVQHVKNSTVRIRDCYVKLGRLDEGHSNKQHQSSAEFHTSTVEQSNSRSPAHQVLDGNFQNDCVIVFMCSLSTSVDVGLVDSVKQHWHVDDSRIYTWKETCSGQITMQSILYYLDVLCSQLRARNFEMAARTIFDETNIVAAECATWMASIEDESLSNQVAAYRSVKKFIQKNVDEINKTANESVVVIVETTTSYGLYLRLCEHTDPMLHIRGCLPHYWRELCKWPSGTSQLSKTRPSSNLSLYGEVEYRSLRKYLKTLMSTVTADDVFLLPSDGVIRSNCSDTRDASVALRLYNALTATGKPRYEAHHRKVFFVGPCSIVCHRKYVLHALPYLISCHLTAQTSLTVVFDTDKELCDSLRHALPDMPKHATVLCLSTFDGITIAPNALLVEVNFAV